MSDFYSTTEPALTREFVLAQSEGVDAAGASIVVACLPGISGQAGLEEALREAASHASGPARRPCMWSATVPMPLRRRRRANWPTPICAGPVWKGPGSSTACIEPEPNQWISCWSSPSRRMPC